MKLISLFATVAISTTLVAQESGSEADKNALRQLKARYEEAISTGHLTPLGDTLTPTASAVFLTGEEVKGLDAMQQYFDGIRQQLGPGSSYRVQVQPDDTQFFGDIALAHGVANETATLGNGTDLNYTTRWTAVLRKIDGTWKTERVQTTLNPFDNPVITSKTRFTAVLWSAIAAVVGVLVGWLFGRRTKAKP